MGAPAAFSRFCPSWAEPRLRCVGVDAGAGVGVGGCDEEGEGGHRPHSHPHWQLEHRVVQVGDSQV